MRQKSCVMKNKRIKLTKFENWMSSNIHECNREYSKLNILKTRCLLQQKTASKFNFDRTRTKSLQARKITHFVRKNGIERCYRRGWSHSPQFSPTNPTALSRSPCSRQPPKTERISKQLKLKER